MKPEEFNRILKTTRQPVMVEFWAPWCRPCKIMAPALKEASEKYEGKVRLVKINADESQDLLRSLKVMSIPTVMGFRGGELVFRKAGVQPASTLESWFGALAEGRDVSTSLRPVDRWFRMIIALIFGISGWLLDQSIVLLLLAGVFFFSAVYDRCPIYRAIVPRVKGLFTHAKS